MTYSEHNYVIVRGKTFQPVIRWGTKPFLYKPITAITKAAPARVTSTAHAIPNGWPCAIVSVLGMTEINTELDEDGVPLLDKFTKASVASSSAIDFNDINASEFQAYVSGGYIQHYTPVDLAGAVARMTIRDRLGGTALETLTSSPASGITIDNVDKRILPVISASDTAAFTWRRAVYDLEVEIATVVYELQRGRILTVDESTT